MHKPCVSYRLLTTCTILGLLALTHSPAAFGAVVVHSMHRSSGGYATASTNGIVQVNTFGNSYTNRGWLRLDRAAATFLTNGPQTSRSSASAIQDSTIAYSPSNFHFNATGGYSVSAESMGSGPGAPSSAALATNRALISFTTDEESVVRVRSTVVDSTPSPTTIILRSSAGTLLRADGLGIQQNGSPVATNGQIHRFTLAPGLYVLELNCFGQATTSGSANLAFDASYRFEFTALYSRYLLTNVRPRFTVRYLAQEWHNGDHTLWRYTRQITWPLGTIYFDLMESPVYPSKIMSPLPPWSWITNFSSLSPIVFGSDGTNFTMTFPEAAEKTNRARFFELQRIP